nr:hypothetical protein [Tanacetum cinerariifolium]
MVSNVDEASTSHNVFNERLEDADFDASTSFHDLSNVHTFYQPYPHEKKWTKDHPLHKIIGDPKSSVRTRGQLANSCLFSCLLSSIEPSNVAEALRDDDWVSAMQEELDSFARLKVWRLVPRPEGKTIIQTKWIFKIKKDESIARIESICLFLAYATHKDFTVFQMDVKATFLNGILNKEVYVGQPLCFVSKQYLDHVYALDKALFGMENYDTVLTLMVKQAKLKLDLVGKLVDHTDYRSMIGSLMYVTLSRLDIMFATCMCARYQGNPNEHHVSAVKRIFRYLKGTINLGLWYSKDFGIDLTAYSDADHAGCHLDRKSTSGSVQFLVLWMRTQLTDYGFFYDKVPIYYDSKSAIAISCNPQQQVFEIYIQDQVQGQRFHVRLIKFQVAQKKVKIAFKNVDSSSRDELIPSKIKMVYKVIVNFHKEFSVFLRFKEKEMTDYFRITCSSKRKKSSSKYLLRIVPK